MSVRWWLAVLLGFASPAFAQSGCPEGESRIELAFRPAADGGPVDAFELLAGQAGQARREALRRAEGRRVAARWRPRPLRRGIGG